MPDEPAPLEDADVEDVPGEHEDPGQGVPAPSPASVQAGSQAMSERDARNWAVGAHLSTFIWLAGLPGVIGPLVVWLLKKDAHPFVDDQGREALNFQLSLLLYTVIAGVVGVVLVLTLVGIVLVPFLILCVLAFAVLAFVLPILAAVRASEGKLYRYPLTIRLLQ
ncbi:MAG: DUF4870 domain-containing protein [Candidatus Thermoplasmatota archaeon]|nr:DUF4870 domain-containing protein [Candidatus Thermoplasmatota archaeon]